MEETAQRGASKLVRFTTYSYGGMSRGMRRGTHEGDEK